jgi:hypothetical protein
VPSEATTAHGTSTASPASATRASVLSANDEPAHPRSVSSIAAATSSVEEVPPRSGVRASPRWSTRSTGAFDGGRGGRLAQVAEQHRSRQDHRDRVRDAPAGDVGALPCTGSNTAYSHPRFAPAASPSPADQPGAQIRDDVAVQVRQQQDVELGGFADQPHRELVDLHLLEPDLRMSLGLDLSDRQEQPVGEPHDVRLVPERDLAPSVRHHELEREPDDPSRAGHRDRLHREPGVLAELPPREPAKFLTELERLGGPSLELDALVQVLGVLADHDEVDVRVPGGQPRERT